MYAYVYVRKNKFSLSPLKSDSLPLLLLPDGHFNLLAFMRHKLYSEDIFTRLIWLTLFWSCYLTYTYDGFKYENYFLTISIFK